MMRAAVIVLLLSLGVTAAALGQTTAPSATPTGGDVGSVALRNGFPAGGGAVALPSIANSSTSTFTSSAGTTTSPIRNFSTSPTTSAQTISGTTGGAANTSSATGSVSGGSFSGGGGGSGGGAASFGNAAGTAARGNGSSSSAGAATATGLSGNGNWVLCPPSGAPGLAPLFTGTDLSCTPD